MKDAYKQILGAAALCVCFLLSTASKARAQYNDGPVTYQTFYDELSSYGQWVEEPQYGYVFVPDVAPGFRPYYTSGYWAMTDYGNTWVSSYPWGWACFHYGRWNYDSYYGWVWVPGTTWGPAWVNWRGSSEYYGWAPLGPDFENGASYGGYYCPDDWWVFIPPQYIYDHHYYQYWNGPRNNHDIVYNTHVVNNTYVNNDHTYYTGPRSSEIQNITHQPVQVYHINSTATPGRTKLKNGTVSMFRPTSVTETRANGTRPSPAAPVRGTQPVSRQPQPVNDNNGNRPSPFQNQIRENNAPRENVQQPAPATNESSNRYGWDVNRAQPQTPRPQQNEPAQQSRPVQQQAAPRQNVPQQSRPMQPAPQPQMSRPAPQPMRSAPAPQPMRSAPAPSPARSAAPANNGGRR